MDIANRQLTPDEIELDFVPARRIGVGEAHLGDELVIASAPFEPCHLLNRTAGLVWDSFDGRADLSTVIDRLAAATGLPRDMIADDVVEATRHMGRLGLLDDVIPRPAEDRALETRHRLAEGDVVMDFELPDRTGRRRKLRDFRDRRVLLAHWRVTCGYCSQIATELADLRPRLAEQGVELLFVSSGDPEDTQLGFDNAGLDDVTVLFKEHGVDPFAGLGTPAAYLVGPDGRLAAPLAYGASEVPDLAARAAGVDRRRTDDAHRYPAGGAGTCGPANGSATRRPSEWAGLAVYDLGGLRVGLRYNSTETAEILDRLFPGARVEDARAQESYSVALHPAGSGAARDLNLLVRSGLQMTRSRSSARVLRALLGHASSALAEPDPALLRVDGLAVVRDGKAFVLPSVLYHTWSLAQPRLNRLGLHVADRPWVTVDPRRAEVVVAEPSVACDLQVLEDLQHPSLRTGSELTEVPPGRYPLALWVLSDSKQPNGPLSQAGAVAQSMGLVTAVPALDAVLAQLATLFETADGYALGYDGAAPFISRLPVALDWAGGPPAGR